MLTWCSFAKKTTPKLHQNILSGGLRRHLLFFKKVALYDCGEPLYDRAEPLYDHAEPLYDRGEPLYDRGEPLYETLSFRNM